MNGFNLSRVPKNLPLFPFLVHVAGVTELHVEVGREDEGQQSDGARAHDVQNAAKVRDRLSDEQQDEDTEGTESAAFPIEI